MRDDELDAARTSGTLPRYAAPEGLRARIAQSLVDEGARRADSPMGDVRELRPAVAVASTPVARPRAAFRRWPIAALFLLSITTAGTLGYWRGAARTGADDPLVASHVRSLVGDHLVDVASADGHTVKPWLDARLDYAPPVTDFTTDGVPLTGGRIDFVAGKRVAVLVYRLRQHVISVYVAPTGALPSSLGRGAESLGYHVERWTSGPMDHVAISDVNAADLARVAELMQSRAPGR